MKNQYLYLLLCCIGIVNADLFHKDENNRFYIAAQQPAPSAMDSLFGTSNTAQNLYLSTIGQRNYDRQPRLGDTIEHASHTHEKVGFLSNTKCTCFPGMACSCSKTWH